MADILPRLIASDPRLKAIADLSERLNGLDVSQLMVYLVERVSATALPFLAEQFSVIGDGYELAGSDEHRRALIRGSIDLHRRKGTPWAVREIIRRLGYGEITLIEGLANKTHNGSITYSGIYEHGNKSAWAKYAVVLERPITNDQAAELRRLLRGYAPARSYLAHLDYQAVAFLYDGAIRHDGQYNHGAA